MQRDFRATQTVSNKHSEIDYNSSGRHGFIDRNIFLILPILLTLLFVAQSVLFNIWLNLYANEYLSRLLFVSFALGTIFYGPAVFLKARARFIYLLCISSFISLIFSVQFLYFKYSEGFLQISSIKYLSQAGSVLGTVSGLLGPQLLFFVSNLAVFFIVVFIEKYGQYQVRKLTRLKIVAITLAMIGIVFFGYAFLLKTEKKEWGNTSRLYTDIYDLKALVGKIGIFNFFVEDAAKYAIRANSITENDKAFLADWAKNRSTAIGAKKLFGAEKGKNVILIQVESLENAVINKKIGGQEITPNLNLLAKAGLYFDNYYSQVGPGNTADAEFSTMTSLYPLSDDVAFVDYAKNMYIALPQLLKNNGFSTYSFHGDAPTFWNRSNVYPNLGYQKAFGLNDYTKTRSIGMGPSDLGDEDLFSQTIPKLEAIKQPFMATIITMSSHTPFILPDDLQTLEIPEGSGLNQTQQQYLESIHYADKAIGEFVNELKKDGLYDNSLIFVWGDHGSFTNIASALSPGNVVLPELSNSQVPLIMVAPGIILNGTTSVPGSHIDIFPTIANLLGINTPKTVLGQDLLNTKTPVATHFKLASSKIDAIITDKESYQSGAGGEFSSGVCKSLPEHKIIPVARCQNLYGDQSALIRASNILVRGNLLNLFLASISSIEKY